MDVSSIKSLEPERVVGTDFCSPGVTPAWRRLLRSLFMKPIEVVSRAVLSEIEKQRLSELAKQLLATEIDETLPGDRAAKLDSLLAQNFLVKDAEAAPAVCILYCVGLGLSMLFFSSIGASLLGAVGLSVLSVSSLSWFSFIASQVCLYIVGTALLEMFDHYTDLSLRNVRLFKAPEEGLGSDLSAKEGSTVARVSLSSEDLRKNLETLAEEERCLLQSLGAVQKKIESASLSTGVLDQPWRDFVSNKVGIQSLFSLEALPHTAKAGLLLDKERQTIRELLLEGKQWTDLQGRLKKAASDFVRKRLNEIALSRFDYVASYLDQKLAGKLLAGVNEQGDSITEEGPSQEDLFQNESLFQNKDVTMVKEAINFSSEGGLHSKTFLSFISKKRKALLEGYTIQGLRQL